MQRLDQTQELPAKTVLAALAAGPSPAEAKAAETTEGKAATEGNGQSEGNARAGSSQGTITSKLTH
jgi:hypothetical protein